MNDEIQNEDSQNYLEYNKFYSPSDNNENNYDIKDENIKNLNKNQNINQNEDEKNCNMQEQNENDNNIEYNDLEEDEYMKQLYINLTKIRKERKEAQDNAKTLDNRLNLLKNQEKRELIKLENTKNKANNKLLKLYEKSENNKIIEKVKQNKNEEIELKKYRVKKMNEEMEKNVKKNEAYRKKQIEDTTKLLKEEKKHNKDIFNSIKEKNQKEKKMKYNVLKSKKNYYDEKKKIEYREKRLMLKKELEQKLLEEYRHKQESEAKKFQAEQEEIEIVKKLQSTTQLYKDLMEEMKKLNINSALNINFGENEEDIKHSEYNSNK